MEDFRECGFGGGDWGIIPLGKAPSSVGAIGGAVGGSGGVGD